MQTLFASSLYVGLSGFEPEMTGPESVVLPLHHSPITLFLRVQRYKKTKTKNKKSNYFFHEQKIRRNNRDPLQH